MRSQELNLSLYKNFSMGKERNLRIEVSSYNIVN